MKLPNIHIFAGLSAWLIFFSGLYAEPEVAGVQSGVWTLAKSPYIVRKDIRVPKGLVLKIEEGVIVKFAGNYQLTVEGTLIASGTKAKPIVFTSIFDTDFGRTIAANNRSAQPSDWKGIEFLDDCDDYTTALNHCIIRFSQWGIRCANCYPLLNDIVFADTRQDALQINNEYYLFKPGQPISPIAPQLRSTLRPLPEPVMETDLEKVRRLMEQQKLKNEQQRLKALQDSLEKANKIKPIDIRTGRIVLEKQMFDQLHVQSINELIGYLPGFCTIATIWTGYQLTSRGTPPSLTNNNVLFQQNGFLFDEPLAKSSFLELASLEAIDRIEVDRGIVITPINHQGINGSVNIVPRQETIGLASKHKIELGNFGTRRLTSYLGFIRDSTAINLAINFMNNSGYWMTFSQENAGSFRQKYASDRYNFSLSFRHASLNMLVSYFDNDQFELGLIPQLQHAAPINRRGLAFSMSQDIKLGPKLKGTIIGNYVKTYERSGYANQDTSDSKINYMLSQGSLLSVSILSQYKDSQYLALAGVTVSKFLANPLFDVKDKEGRSLTKNYWHNDTKFSQHENSGFVELGYNFSPFFGVDGKTCLHFANSSEKPDFSMSARLIYSPLSLFDSHLKYSFASQPATLLEKYIYIPGLIYGNDDLKSEQFEQWEWSTDVHLKPDLTLGLALYQSKNSHIIQLAQDYRFANNSKELKTTGCEVMFQGKVFDRSWVLTNIAYNHVKTSGWYCPNWKINSLVNFHWFQHFSSTTAIQYLSEITTSYKLGPYYLVNLSLAYQLNPKLKISFHGFNLLDQRLENPEYFRGELSAIPACSGRSFYMTLAIE